VKSSQDRKGEADRITDTVFEIIWISTTHGPTRLAQAVVLAAVFQNRSVMEAARLRELNILPSLNAYTLNNEHDFLKSGSADGINCPTSKQTVSESNQLPKEVFPKWQSISCCY
jgi:hypothetical protein